MPIGDAPHGDPGGQNGRRLWCWSPSSASELENAGRWLPGNFGAEMLGVGDGWVVVELSEGASGLGGGFDVA